jgi:hypothetical protein
LVKPFCPRRKGLQNGNVAIPRSFHTLTMKPDDFPVHSDRNKILTATGKPVAVAQDG